MYARAAQPVAPATNIKRAWPIAGICCLGLIGLMIASTIVLALIPLYLQNRQVTVNNINTNDVVYLRYLSSGDGTTSLTGTLTDAQSLSELEQRINQGMPSPNVGITIKNGVSQTGFSRRRRRSLVYHRFRRDISTTVVLTCEYKYRKDCLTEICRKSTQKRINEAIEKTKTFTNVQLRVSNKQSGITSSTATLVFDEILNELPDGLGVEPETAGQFVAVQSGEFTDSSTWKNEIVPYGNSTILIPPGISVTLTKALVDLYIEACEINGTLTLGSSSNDSIQFTYPVNLIVYPDGTLIDNTGGHIFDLAKGSIVTVYPGGTFTGDGTVINSESSKRSLSRDKRSLQLPSGPGPRTCGLLPNGQQQSFEKVTSMVCRSSEFSSSSTWLGGRAPTRAGCALAGGAGLSISAGFSLSTASLNGQLDMNFNLISIEASARFRMGTFGSSFGFKFQFRLKLQCYGVLEDATGGTGGIYIPAGSVINFFPGGSFFSIVATSLIIYDPLSGTILSRFTLSASFSGPFYISVSLSGFVSTSTTLPGEIGSDATAAPVTTVAAPETQAPTTATTAVPETEATTTTVAPETEATTTTAAPETEATTTTVAPETEATTTTAAPETEATTITVTPTTVFTVIKSGDFNDISVWANGQIPSGKCSIVIPTGFTLTFTGEIFNIEVTTLTIGGSFVISSTVGFTFQFAINIIVQDGGTFEDQTTTHILYFFAGSLCTFYTKASFVGSATVIYQFTALPVIDNLGTRFTLGASFTGAFTFGILFSGEIQYFNSVTFIVGISGSFSVDTTWLGDIAPTADICDLVGGCGLYIPSGCVLSTPSLSGELNINFIVITIATGGTFELGTIDWEFGFRFKFAFIFNIYGTLSFLPSIGGSIYLPFGCTFNFFVGAKFFSLVDITIRIYDVLIGGEGTLLIIISASFTGPYSVTITLDGQVIINSESTTTFEPTSTPGLSTGEENTVATSETSGSTTSGHTTIGEQTGGEITVTTAGTPESTTTIGLTKEITTPEPHTGGEITVTSSGTSQGTTTLGQTSGITASNTVISSGTTTAESQTGGEIAESTTTLGQPSETVTSEQSTGWEFTTTRTETSPSESTTEQSTGGEITVTSNGPSETTTTPGITDEITITGESTSQSTTTLGRTGEIIITGESTNPTVTTAGTTGESGATTQTSGGTYIVVKSGLFTSLETWDRSQIPAGNCSIIIPAGFTLTFSGEILDVEIYTLTIRGNFVISSTVGFTFQYTINIIIEDGGTFEDQTTTHVLYFFLGSLCTFYSKASFVGSGTVIFAFTALPATANLGASFTLGGSFTGAYTFGILLNGEMQYFESVTYILRLSGSFTDDVTWLGGIAPTKDLCDLVGGCGLYIPTGYTLLTASLNGRLDINFVFITVATGGTFELGALDWTGGFRFMYELTFNIYGILNFLSTSGGSIYLPFGCAFNLFASAKFESTVDISLMTFNLALGDVEGILILTLSTSFVGPYYISISTEGTVEFPSEPATQSPTTTAQGTVSSTETQSTADASVTTTSNSVPTNGPISSTSGQSETTASSGSGTGAAETTASSVSGTGAPETTASNASGTGAAETTASSGSGTGAPETTASAEASDTTQSSGGTYTVVKTGLFSSVDTWDRGQLPTGICSIIIPVGFTLTFSGAILDIQIETLTIQGSFSISSTTDFTFQYAINIIIENGGVFQDLTTNHRLFFFAGSLCIFYSQASFVGSGTVIFAFTALPASDNLGASFVLGDSFTGAFTFGILLSGELQHFDTVTFIVGISGSFTDDETWLGGFAPTKDLCDLQGGCGLYIPSGCSLLTASLSGQLDINFDSVTVASGGTFELGALDWTGGFRFMFECIFNVYGTLDFLPTSGGNIYLPFGCGFNFYTDASFESSVTINLMTFDASLGAVEGTLMTSLSSDFSGPYYAAVSTDGTVETDTNPITSNPETTTAAQATGGTYVVAKTGLFSSTDTWDRGEVPSGICSIIIPAGFTLTFLGDILDIQVETLTIQGSFSISSMTDFTFQYAINIIIENGGVFQHLTANSRLFFFAGSLCTFYSQASFVGSGTVIFAFTALPASSNLGASFTLGDSFTGAFTFGILLSGELQYFDSVTFIVGLSGSFTDGGTWLGGLAPTADLCDLVGGCGLYIPSGCSLLTASLNGQLDINFNEITVASGGTFELGSLGLAGGFRFMSEFIFNVYGTLSFLPTSGGSIYLPFGCGLNFFGDASFQSSTDITINTFDVTLGAVEGTVMTSLSTDFSGPYYAAVSVDGTVETATSPITAAPDTTTQTTGNSVTNTAAIGGIYTVVKTGLFSSIDTWDRGQIPAGICSIIIPVGFTLTFAGDILDIQVETLTIQGSFVISTSADFTFQYAINIIIENNGIFQDLTANHRLIFFAGSLCTFYPQASFVGSGTVIVQFTALPASANLGASFTLGDSFTGGYTFGILLSGEIQHFDSVTFIVGISGSFSLGATWLGGLAPSVDFCNLVGGCGLYIPSGCSLLTASLNGQLNINFAWITIASGGTFSLGALDWTGGFRFMFGFIFNIYGTLNFLSATGGSIYLPFGCGFNFYADASFLSSVSINLMTYDVSLGAVEGKLVTSLLSDFSDSYFVTISTNGSIETSESPITSNPETTTAAQATGGTYVVAKTGLFSSTETWDRGEVPSGICSIIIPAGFTLTFIGDILDIQVEILTIEGSFTISSSADFTFQFAINIIIKNNGIFQDLTTNHRLFFFAGSLCTFYPQAAFVGSGTVIYQFTALPANANLGASFTLGDSFTGGYTFGILLSGEIQHFNSIAFIARISGSFTDDATWLGGLAPTVDFCNSVGGCGLYIPSGCSLLTASLNGQLNINFAWITIASGGIFSLGALDWTGGFRFMFGFIFNIYGTLSFLPTSGGSIYLPFGCGFNFYAVASFLSSIGIDLKGFDASLGNVEGTFITSLSALFSAPYYVAVSTVGAIEISANPITAIHTGTFTVSKNGFLNNVDTWDRGEIPSGVCSIVIPTGFSLAFAGDILDIQIETLTIQGTFVISSTAGFTFKYAINIIIEDGGSFQDQTATHILYFFAGSLCTFYPQASFVGSGTVIYQFTALPASANLGASFTLGGSFTGAYTFGVLLSGGIQYFNSIAFIARISGSFTDGATWLGGLAPTVDFCNLVGGCGLYIPSGCSLLTASLSGRLDIKFAWITVASGGTLSLGALDWTGGFRFMFGFIFNIYGTLNFLSTTGGSIYLPYGCGFNYYTGASFLSSLTINLRGFDVTLGDVDGTLVVPLSALFNAPYYVLVAKDGHVEVKEDPVIVIPDIAPTTAEATTITTTTTTTAAETITTATTAAETTTTTTTAAETTTTATTAAATTTTTTTAAETTTATTTAAAATTTTTTTAAAATTTTTASQVSSGPSLSVNQPKLCAGATWDATAVTFANFSIVGDAPSGIFINKNNTIYVINWLTDYMYIWLQGSTQPDRTIYPVSDGPNSIFVRPNGSIYVDAAYSQYQIREYSFNASNYTILMDSCSTCYGLFMDTNDVLYCSQYLKHVVLTKSFGQRMNVWQYIAGVVDSCGSAAHQLCYPRGIFVDVNFNLYIADAGNNRIQKFAPGQVNGTTVAGGSTASLTITLATPTAVTLDADGYLFIVDQAKHRIVGSDANGFRCIAACAGYAGITATTLSSPPAMAFDSSGNLYVVDWGNDRIQKFALTSNACGSGGTSGSQTGTTATTTTTTSAPTVYPAPYNLPKFNPLPRWNGNGYTFVEISRIGTYPYSMFLDTNNTLYVPDQANDRVLIFADGNNASVRTLSGGLADPYGVVAAANGDVYVDNGAVYFRVDKWTPSATTSVKAMSTSYYCYDLFLDINNNLYCSVFIKHQVVMKSLDSNSDIWTFAAGTSCAGSGRNQLNGPYGIFVDADLNLYVADYYNDRIQKFPANSRSGITVVGATAAAPGTVTLSGPAGITLDGDGYMYIAELLTHRILAQGPDGFRCILGCSKIAGVQTGQFNNPSDLKFDNQGNIYIADRTNARIQKFMLLPNDTYPSSVNQPTFSASAAWTLTAPVYINSTYTGVLPNGIFVDIYNTLYLANWADDKVYIFNEGNQVPDKTLTLATGFDAPLAAFATYSGDIYVDNGWSFANILLWPKDTTANTTTKIIEITEECYDLFIDISNTIYCAATVWHQILRKWLPDTRTGFNVAAGTVAGSGASQLNLPKGIFVDANFAIYVADSVNNRIQKFTTGQVDAITVAGTADTITLKTPKDIILDGNGYMFIVDSGNNRIIAQSSSGFRCIFGCDGTAGTGSNQLSDPRSFSFDTHGNIYVVNGNDPSVKKVLLAAK